ncbi:MAG TPA: pyridoxamine 5'-phosphate oxidase family protein [Dehalococcoidia bacterium]|nr:pyridoxamine 5'-phosphate oxidase family protein [Dehalococcoidia bacterium]
MTAPAAPPLSIDDRGVRDALRAKTLRIVTVSKRGRPMIMPLWFVVRDGRICMTNAATSPTVRNIAANPRVLILVEARDGHLLHIRGEARYLTNNEALGPVARRSALKYYADPRALWLYARNVRRIPAMLQYYRERTDTGVIEVTPVSFEWTDARP